MSNLKLIITLALVAIISAIVTAQEDAIMKAITDRPELKPIMSQLNSIMNRGTEMMGQLDQIRNKLPKLNLPDMPGMPGIKDEINRARSTMSGVMDRGRDLMNMIRRAG